MPRGAARADDFSESASLPFSIHLACGHAAEQNGRRVESDPTRCLPICLRLVCANGSLRPHFEYRLMYILNGERLVGFDNGRGKGDHKHLDGKESACRFVSIDQLLDDYIAGVERRVE
ncbi:MAG: DUF6516 family protein [Pseudomonadota bacterium]|jgi:hypothetical protein